MIEHESTKPLKLAVLALRTAQIELEAALEAGKWSQRADEAMRRNIGQVLQLKTDVSNFAHLAQSTEQGKEL